MPLRLLNPRVCMCLHVFAGKLLVLGCCLHMVGPALTLAAALSVQSPFMRLEEGNERAK
jgi:hypothetical protein